MQFTDGPAISLEGHVVKQTVLHVPTQNILITPIEFQHTIAREVYF